MDALKDRVGAFTEGILLMSSPVILAVALKKVDLNSEGNPAVRRSISPLAAGSLCISLIAFLLLVITSLLAPSLQQTRSGHLIEHVFRISKLLVHACAVLQMVLAFMVLLLITMKLMPFLVLPLVLGVFLAFCCYLSVRRSPPEQSERNHRDRERKLEPSLEFSATVTSLLFLALEGLALEGQASIGQGLDHRFVPAIGLTFVACLVAMIVMLLATVPPYYYYHGNGTNNQAISDHQFQEMCTVLHGLCLVLTVFLTAVVLVITFELEKEKGITAIVPCLILLLWYLLCLCDPHGTEAEMGEVKPASLELTKVTFTGFLAVSLPSIRDGSLGRNTHAFVLITSMAVLSGILWRLLTHFKQRAAVWTAKAACLCTHVFVAAAAIPFMFMAIHALYDAGDECHVPCSSSTPSTQLNLFVACFVGKARETSSYTLSSVNC
ncbi:hypothetical protein ACP4OV_013316 [Aristida adscensionis]